MGNVLTSARANDQGNRSPQRQRANFTANGHPFIHIDPRITVDPEAVEKGIEQSAPVQEIKQDCTNLKAEVVELKQNLKDAQQQMAMMEEASVSERARVDHIEQVSGQTCSRKEMKTLEARQDRQLESHKKHIIELEAAQEKIKVGVVRTVKEAIKTCDHYIEQKKQFTEILNFFESLQTRTLRVPLQTRIEEMREGQNHINQSPRSNSSDDSHYLELQLEEPQVRYREDAMLGRSRRPLQGVDTNNQQEANWDSIWKSKGYKELSLPNGLFKKMSKEEAQRLGTDLSNLLRDHGVDTRREISEYPNLIDVVKDFLAADPQQGWAIQIFSDQKSVKQHQSKHLVLMFGRIGINLMGFEKKRPSN